MTATESTLTNRYRLEVRNGRAGWRWHVRGPTGIEASAVVAHATRDDALEEGRATLREYGLESWDEWMDGVTDNRYDPRTERVPTVDSVLEAKRAGLTPPDPAAEARATEAIKELEAKRTAAMEEKRARAEKAPPDAGMGLDGGPAPEAPAEAPSPLKAQRKKASGVQKTAGG